MDNQMPGLRVKSIRVIQYEVIEVEFLGVGLVYRRDEDGTWFSRYQQLEPKIYVEMLERMYQQYQEELNG